MIKNVLYILNDGFLGGAGHSLLDTMKEIRKFINPIIIMPKAADAKCVFESLNIHCYEVDFIVDYVKIGDVTVAQQKVDYKQSYEAALQLLPIIKKEKIQLIHINSSVSYFGAIAALTAGIPYVWHIRELMEEQFGCEFLNIQLKYELYARAERLVVISDYVKQKYYEKYSLKTERIYDGIDIQKYKISVDNDKEFPPYFLMAAVISQGKGQIDAVRAIEILLKQGYSDVRLVIAGAQGSGYEWALKKYIRNTGLVKNIKILPFQDDLTELHRWASYALTCSQCEALGRVTIEAMLGGNVVIGADSGGTREIIGGDEKRGFLYELHNSESLANVMIQAMQCSKDAKRQMLVESQKYAENIFDIGQYCIKIVEMYNDVYTSFIPKDNKFFLDELKEKYREVNNKATEENRGSINKNQKAEAAFFRAIKWLEVKQSGHNLSEYFKEQGYRSVAIYGMADLGRRLYDELENSDIEIRYLLDKNPGDMAKLLPFVSLDCGRLDVDVIVVTVAAGERNIVNEIREYGYNNVIGLSELLKQFDIKK